jgi:hypothetical protein
MVPEEEEEEEEAEVGCVSGAVERDARPARLVEPRRAWPADARFRTQAGWQRLDRGHSSGSLLSSRQAVHVW